MTDDLQQARVEAAARAMYEFRELRTDPKWADVEHGVQEEYRKDARAALAAADAIQSKAKSSQDFVLPCAASPQTT